jgi:ABC-type sugar transport system permease subunit
MGIEAPTAWVFLAPAMTVISLCVLLPIALALALSFTHCSRFFDIHWAGLDNYRRLADESLALKAFGNTLLYLAMFVPANLALSLGVASLLSARFPGIRLIRSVYFVPVAVSGVVAVSIFRFILDPRLGPLNALLTTVGLSDPAMPVDWLKTPSLAMPAIVLLTLWKSTAFNSIIFLAAMQGIPRERYEAASVDGAGPVARFLHVTVPGLMPVIMVVVTLSTIGAFRVFEPMFVLTGGGPMDATRTISLLAYDAALGDGEIGYANAITFSMVIIILAVTLLLNRVARRFDA